MDLDKVFEDIQNLKNLVIQIGKGEKAAVKELSRLHKIVFKEPVCATCHNKHIRAYQTLISLSKEQIMSNAEKQYALKPGKAFILNKVFGSDKYYFNHNLTDKVAEEHLGNHPGDIKLFEKFPEDWEKRVKKNSTAEAEYTPEEIAGAYKKGKSIFIGEDKITKAVAEKLGIEVDKLEDKGE